jgi:hypothetical protein
MISPSETLVTERQAHPDMFIRDGKFLTDAKEIGRWTERTHRTKATTYTSFHHPAYRAKRSILEVLRIYDPNVKRLTAKRVKEANPNTSNDIFQGSNPFHSMSKDIKSKKEFMFHLRDRIEYEAHAIVLDESGEFDLVQNEQIVDAVVSEPFNDLNDLNDFNDLNDSNDLNDLNGLHTPKSVAWAIDLSDHHKGRQKLKTVEDRECFSEVFVTAFAQLHGICD